MVADFSIRGAEKFAAVARDLKAAGDKELRRELYRGINRATKPLKEDAKKSAASTLPSRGGLAGRVSRARFSTKTRAGASPSVRIVAKDAKGRSVDLAALDGGRLRHPLYGNRGHWYTQSVKPEWFTRPMLAGADKVRREIVAAVDAVAAKLSK